MSFYLSFLLSIYWVVTNPNKGLWEHFYAAGLWITNSDYGVMRFHR